MTLDGSEYYGHNWGYSFFGPREKDKTLKCPNCGEDLWKDGIERICTVCKKHFSLITGELLEVEYIPKVCQLKCPYSAIIAKQGRRNKQ